MTIQEAEQIARNGDVEMMMTVGEYYLNEDNNTENTMQRLDASLPWFELAAKHGNLRGMEMCSPIMVVKAETLRRICGDYREDIFNFYQAALQWGTLANEKGGAVSVDSACFGLGWCYTRMGIAAEENSAKFELSPRELYQKGLSYFGRITKLDEEDKMYYAICLQLKGPSTRQEEEIFYSLVKDVVDKPPSCCEQDRLSVFYYWLGDITFNGKGTSKNDDKAYRLYKKATELGLDCSELLKNFKKKLLSDEYIFVGSTGKR